MVTLVVTEGNSSLDLYSQNLARHVKANLLKTDAYRRCSSTFNAPWLSKRSLSAFFYDLSFIMKLRKVNDVIHFPSQHLGRYAFFAKKPYIITVHDLIRFMDLTSNESSQPFIHKPNSRDRFYFSLDYKGVKKADVIIAISNNTKRDLIEKLGVEEERIRVVYPGVDHEVFRPVRERSPVEGRYILYVGTEQPRKNVRTLVKVLKRLKEDREFRDVRLVKVGRPGGREHDFRSDTIKAVRELGLVEGKDVIFVDHVPTEELPAYYSNARCFLLLSLYEGFGLTVLEAMACGCPVITSNVSSLPEVAGDAAILVDPLDVDGVVENLKDVLRNDALRKELIGKGLARASLFSWERTGKEVMKVYEEVDSSLREEAVQTYQQLGQISQ